MKIPVASSVLALALAWCASSCSCNEDWTRPKTGAEANTAGGDSGEGEGQSIEGEGVTTEGEGIEGEGTEGEGTEGESTEGEGAEGEGTEGEGNTTEGEGNCATTDSYGITWLCIPAGAYQMGCSPGDTTCGNDEKPAHQVTVTVFKMTETEITQAQYQAVTGTNPARHTGCGGNCPVERVDWNQAKAFCKAVGGRLPSEAEWEYAARAGTTTKYYCGDSDNCLDEIAWYEANSSSTTHAVKGKLANSFGLYDMLGNVWEWVEDCWHWDYQGAPNTGEAWVGGDCFGLVLRGGSGYYNYPYYLRASYRYWYDPAYGDYYYGFRCASSSL